PQNPIGSPIQPQHDLPQPSTWIERLAEIRVRARDLEDRRAASWIEDGCVVDVVEHIQHVVLNLDVRRSAELNRLLEAQVDAREQRRLDDDLLRLATIAKVQLHTTARRGRRQVPPARA